MRGCGLLPYAREKSALRSELAKFVDRNADSAVQQWMEAIGSAFSIPHEQRFEVQAWMQEALARWVRHIEDPEDLDTYLFLDTHARHAFASRFPASRFLCGQMKIREILCQRLRETFHADVNKRDQFLALIEQEFRERMLHISDFSIRAREEELQQQESSYRDSVDNAPAVIFRLVSETGAILDANRVAEEMMGFDRQEMLAMTIWDLLPEAEHEKTRRLFRETEKYGHATRDDLHVVCQDRTVLPVFFSGGLVEYRQQKTYQVICVDISARRRLESQLVQSEKMAAIGQLAAGIAHEIRNPLGIIANAVYDLNELVDSSEPAVQEDLKIAREEMARVQAIINNLLEFSRDSRADVENIDINQLLRRTLQLMNKSLQRNGVRVTTEFEENVSCRANQNALRQIFLNLVTNALQAMPNGGKLELRTRSLPNNRVRMQIRDSGKGIPAEAIDDVFNPFFTTKEPGHGTGLGLSIVHSFVERFDGTIRVESTPDQGAEFTIEFPSDADEGLVGN